MTSEVIDARRLLPDSPLHLPAAPRRRDKETVMTFDVPFLRRVLLLDAASCLLMGAGLSLGATLAADLTSLSVGLLRGVGLVLLPIAAFIAFVATRETLSRALVWTVIVGNVIWVSESLVLLAGGFVAPNVLGVAFVLGQAAAVAGLAALEAIGARRIWAQPMVA
jgi:hypothetical protein